jgi:hypothetical protein
MPKRRKVPLPGTDPTSSYRWSTLFANVEEAEALLLQPGWRLLQSDLMDKAAQHSNDIVHGIPATAEKNAEMNFWRGKVAAFEDLIGLAEELEEWKKALKERSK